MSRFEHADKIIKRLRKRYRRKGIGRVLAKQSDDPRIVPSRKFLGARDELSAANERERARRPEPTNPFSMPSFAPLPGRSNRKDPDDDHSSAPQNPAARMTNRTPQKPRQAKRQGQFDNGGFAGRQATRESAELTRAELDAVDRYIEREFSPFEDFDGIPDLPWERLS
jgi:hypothetical protein